MTTMTHNSWKTFISIFNSGEVQIPLQLILLLVSLSLYFRVSYMTLITASIMQHGRKVMAIILSLLVIFSSSVSVVRYLFWPQALSGILSWILITTAPLRHPLSSVILLLLLVRLHRRL